MTSDGVQRLTVLLLLVLSSGCTEQTMTFPALTLTLKDDLVGTFFYSVHDSHEQRRVVLELDEETLRVLELDSSSQGGRPASSSDASYEPLALIAAFPIVAHVDMVYVYNSSVDCTHVDWTTRPWEERWFAVIDWDQELVDGVPGELMHETPDDEGSRELWIRDPINACTIGGEPLPDAFFGR